MKPLTVVLILLCLVVSWYYAACYWSASDRGIPVEFYPFWNASKAILHHTSPYGPEVTEQNQIAAYGAPVRVLGIRNQQRFAYPVYGLLSLLPLGLLQFRAANNIAFALFAVLAALAVGWLRGKWDWTTVLYCTLAFSAYPIIYDLRSRQPALLFFGLAVASLALLRSGRLIPAGIMAALSIGKPHLALPVILAELIWALAKWRERRRFAISLLTCSLGLLALSNALSPGWISEWGATLRAYSQYNQPSLVVSLFGRGVGLALSALLVLGLIAVLWLHRHSELLFQVSLSVVIFLLLVPYANYNAVMLLIPTIWVMDNSHFLSVSGEVNQFMLGAVRVTIMLFLAANAAGAILLHTSHLGKFIGWVLPSMVTHSLLCCLVAMMTVQHLRLFARQPQQVPAARPTWTGS